MTDIYDPNGRPVVVAGKRIGTIWSLPTSAGESALSIRKFADGGPEARRTSEVVMADEVADWPVATSEPGDWVEFDEKVRELGGGPE